MTRVEYTIAMRKALAEEKVSLIAYCLMLVLFGKETVPLCEAARELGMIYPSVRSQTFRHPAWFKTHQQSPGSTVSVSLTKAGTDRLDAIIERMKLTS